MRINGMYDPASEVSAATEWQQDRRENMERNDWLRYAGLMPTNQQAFYTREELLSK